MFVVVVTQPVSLSEAKAQLAGLVHAAEGGEVVHISRHGKPVAVLLSEQAYAALQGQQQRSKLWEAIAQWRSAGQTSLRRTGPWRLASLERRLSRAGVNVLLDTNVLSDLSTVVTACRQPAW